MVQSDALEQDGLADMLGMSFADLLTPIAGHPAGDSLKGSALYATIRQARDDESATLPLGSWGRELKRADWPLVGRLCRQAIASQSKGLQLAMWLLEAEVHQHGFAALASCINLITGLSATFWPQLHPQDLEERDELFRWMAEKLSQLLRCQAFTARDNEQVFCWADWEHACRNAQSSLAAGRELGQAGGVTLDMIGAALAAPPTSHFLALQALLEGALAALEQLESMLTERRGQDAPSFARLRDMIENISLMIATELRRRDGMPPAHSS